jgi:sugar phosphate isomerase/epimerase
MKIYPKISAQDFSEEMKKILLESEGVELQFFDETGPTSEINFEDLIRKTKKQFKNLKSIVIHPPLSNYNIEFIMLKDEGILERQLKKLVELSDELDIELSIIYHTYLTKEQFISIELIDRLKRLLKIIEGKNIYLLIENLFMMLDERKGCSALEIVKFIDNPNLKVCIDTTHLHCKANIWKKDFCQLLEDDLIKEDCEKYVKQIHFAAVLDNDGYINMKTHGRKHINIEEIKKELEWLEKYGMRDKIYVTEVSEDDYYTRKDQIEEIKMLQNAMK